MIVDYDKTVKVIFVYDDQYNIKHMIENVRWVTQNDKTWYVSSYGHLTIIGTTIRTYGCDSIAIWCHGLYLYSNANRDRTTFGNGVEHYNCSRTLHTALIRNKQVVPGELVARLPHKHLHVSKCRIGAALRWKGLDYYDVVWYRPAYGEGTSSVWVPSGWTKHGDLLYDTYVHSNNKRTH